MKVGRTWQSVSSIGFAVYATQSPAEVRPT